MWFVLTPLCRRSPANRRVWNPQARPGGGGKRCERSATVCLSRGRIHNSIFFFVRPRGPRGRGGAHPLTHSPTLVAGATAATGKLEVTEGRARGPNLGTVWSRRSHHAKNWIPERWVNLRRLRPDQTRPDQTRPGRSGSADLGWTWETGTYDEYQMERGRSKRVRGMERQGEGEGESERMRESCLCAHDPKNPLTILLHSWPLDIYLHLLITRAPSCQQRPTS